MPLPVKGNHLHIYTNQTEYANASPYDGLFKHLSNFECLSESLTQALGLQKLSPLDRYDVENIYDAVMRNEAFEMLLAFSEEEEIEEPPASLENLTKEVRTLNERVESILKSNMPPPVESNKENSDLKNEVSKLKEELKIKTEHEEKLLDKIKKLSDTLSSLKILIERLKKEK